MPTHDENDGEDETGHDMPGEMITMYTRLAMPEQLYPMYDNVKETLEKEKAKDNPDAKTIKYIEDHLKTDPRGEHQQEARSKIFDEILGFTEGSENERLRKLVERLDLRKQ